VLMQRECDVRVMGSAECQRESRRQGLMQERGLSAASLASTCIVLMKEKGNAIFYYMGLLKSANLNLTVSIRVV